ncbi:hypothetical protein CMO91_01590 [Candidatus Woesearchaeota archaeon]|jgi:integral membrane protein (TIGR01906 family)|nr:hypothetical protein [Candidatus Woesearchaeota archaeon]
MRNTIVLHVLLALFPITLLLLSANLVMYNPLAYSLGFWHAGTYDSFGVGEPDKAANSMIAYFLWREKLDLELTDDERSHMADVKDVMHSVTAAFALLLWLTVGCMLLLPNKRAALLVASRQGIWLLAPLALIMVFFSRSFIWFHEWFFPQGNYTFPPDSYLIRLLPEIFFVDMLLMIVLLYVVSCWLLQLWAQGRFRGVQV